VKSADAASPVLRAFHLLVFLGFAAGAIAGMLPELQQLFTALSHKYHCGTIPSPLGTASAIAAFLASVTLLVYLARGRSAPLWISGVVLVAFVVTLWQQSYPFSRRSTPGANLAMLEVAKQLHEAKRQQLQETGAVDTDEAAWAAALAKIEADNPGLSSPFRRRSFDVMPWRLEMIASEDLFLVDATPGTFTVFVPKDASRFTITMIGLDPEHQTVRLRDDQGEAFSLKGAYTPDTRN